MAVTMSKLYDYFVVVAGGVLVTIALFADLFQLNHPFNISSWFFATEIPAIISVIIVFIIYTIVIYIIFYIIGLLLKKMRII